MPVETNKGKPRPRPPRADELPAGIPAEVAAPVPRDERGRMASSEAARALGARGNRSEVRRQARDTNKWARQLGLGGLLNEPELAIDPRFRAFRDEAQEWFKATCGEIAEKAGGGSCGAMVTSIIRTSAWQRAFSAWLFELSATQLFAWNRDEAGGAKPPIDPRTDLSAHASRLGSESRSNLQCAWELAAKEAEADRKRPQRKDDAFSARLDKLIELEQARALPPKPPTIVDVPEQPLPAASPPAAPVAAQARPAPSPAPTDPARPFAPPRATSGQPAYAPPVSAERLELDALDGMYPSDGPGRIAHARAVVTLIGSWLTDTQKKYDRWTAGGRRGPRTWPARVIPLPYSTTWIRCRPKGEPEIIERDYLWTFEREAAT